MRKAYSPAQMAEAVSLATIVGAEAAGRQLRIDPRTVRGWMERAGKAPADALTSPDWQQLGDLARSQVAASLVSGSVRPKDAAVIAAIAQRNVRDVPADLDEPSAGRKWIDALEAALEARYGNGSTLADELLDALIVDALRFLSDESRVVDDDNISPAVLVARLPDDWDEWRRERAERQQAEDEANDARRTRSREAWPAYFAGRITAEQRDAWIAGGPNPIEAIEREETAALLAAAEAGFRA